MRVELTTYVELVQKENAKLRASKARMDDDGDKKDAEIIKLRNEVRKLNRGIKKAKRRGDPY